MTRKKEFILDLLLVFIILVFIFLFNSVMVNRNEKIDVRKSEIFYNKSKINKYNKIKLKNNEVFQENKVDEEILKNNISINSNKKEKIDINSNDVHELTKLSGIGIKTAQKIIEYRKKHGDFKKTSDIIRVSGIGNRKYKKFKENIIIKSH